ncbi:bifunctional (p)ppGpp synthetase/guanosine-3',5'-bis(diphosphate) 3'-pyrophosphohydrolase [Parasphingopyxis sp. CP4]|uniref:RelA/SpoT family protein n=1 Tax=Parasphingopyxis sp. CP4 TaxID=2724527 RepID=UPI0015A347B4|nr:bifunctional (p)ppGpp synthetase/guanosine-3',5'-bis(diphosphate) 3'-pyrophosphohydrolase [Parasphingopyxis sp. CP4]QLC23175.1 bifunctional (p)ppGpp synthetase/guanosine-3',5'-bis(diphosphate) 3'-pyrophosphohydrolase [Parasphingopyxis sp. CP4]
MLRQYELIERVKSYDPGADEALINRAYVFSVNAHGTQKRASGDPYFSHPIEVAGILTDLRLDDETIATAILHDTIEDTVATQDEIEDLFGENVARLVDGVTKLSTIEAQSDTERAAENLRKFLLAMSGDIRVLLVKLADRLHNMRTLHFIKSEAKRRRIARETMDIYAPLAERIGMYEFMKEMQTLAFQHLEPDAYESISTRLDRLREGEGGETIDRIAEELKLVLGSHGVDADVTGREKHPYSIWRKMAERHVSFETLTDVMAFRAIVPDVAACYQALGILHEKWHMVPGRFKDYISTPKRNGYRSIHTSIQYGEDRRIEIQIRSQSMHEQAENGLAAHWSYKQGDRPDGQASWLRDLIEILETTESPEELLEHTRMAMYQDRIFAFSPAGELIQLPKGATVVDFAFEVHTDLGKQTVGAKVNGRVVPLRTQLENGDQVRILRSDNQHPDPGWLSFVVTGKARAAIRRFVRQKEKAETISLGRKLFDQVVARLPAPLGRGATKAALKRLKLAKEDALMEKIARKEIDDRALMEALMPGMGTGDLHSAVPPKGQAISIKGLTPGVAFQLAECCHPIPGDRIVGLRRTGEDIEIHTIDCDTLADGNDADWLAVNWGDGSDGGTAPMRVVLKNEPGSLAVMAGIYGTHGANILNVKLENRDGSFHSFCVDIEVHNRAHLMRILAALRAAEVVSQAERI